MARAFEEAQEKGQIPWDEPFMPGSVLYIPGRKESFPLWLSLDARAEIERLHQQGQCYQPVPSSAVGEDQAGNFRAIAYILTSSSHGVITQTAMRRQRFPVVLSEVLDDIVVLELFERLKLVLNGNARPTSARSIDEECERFRSQFRLHAAGGYGESPLVR